MVRHTEYTGVASLTNAIRCWIPYKVPMYTDAGAITHTFYRTADGTVDGRAAVYGYGAPGWTGWASGAATTVSANSDHGFSINISPPSGSYTAGQSYLVSVGWKAESGY